ncbi:MAG: photosynthetic reaction center cytochrome c subunit family protein [Bryobacteraceae bacterium]
MRWIAGYALCAMVLFGQTETPDATKMRMEKLTAKLSSQVKEVTCFTCHRGVDKIVPTPPPFAAVKVPADVPTLTPEQAKLPSEQVFKNIDIMKGVPAGRLVGAMRFFSASLGVTCAHCHVDGDYASEDKKPKKTARKMMAIVRSAQEFFPGPNNPVSCWGCHNGKVEPAEK